MKALVLLYFGWLAGVLSAVAALAFSRGDATKGTKQ